MPGIEDIPYLEERIRVLEARFATTTSGIVTSSSSVESATTPTIYHGAGAPTIIPTKIGDTYIDDTNLNTYTSAATAGTYSWAYTGKAATSADDTDGLTSWYDASDSLTPKTNGATLTGWNDKGSKMNHLTSVYNTPQYFENVQNGLPAAYFTTNERISGSDRADQVQPQTHFVVCKPTAWSTGDYQFIVHMYAETPSIGKNTGSTATRISAGAVFNGPSISNDTTCLLTAVFNGASSSIAVNDGAATTGNAGANANSNSPGIGGKNNNTYFYTGYVMEWRVYNGVLTDERKTNIQAILNNKWAIY